MYKGLYMLKDEMKGVKFHGLLNGVRNGALHSLPRRNHKDEFPPPCDYWALASKLVQLLQTQFVYAMHLGDCSLKYIECSVIGSERIESGALALYRDVIFVFYDGAEFIVRRISVDCSRHCGEILNECR